MSSDPSQQADTNTQASALSAKLETLPTQPGVYLFKDSQARVLYVGKARNLRQRVRSYFGASRGDERILLPFLRARVVDLDVIQVANEKEAFLLENTLIKRYKPRYNVRLVDDKTFLSLRLDPTHRFPRFTTVRKRRNDGARYFGPYSSARSIRHTLKLIYRAFGVRSCSDAVMANRTRPCLYYQLGQCLAPCVDYVTDDEYGRAVECASLLLEGQGQQVLDRLHRDMSSQADAERFEDAARTRDTIRAVERSLERQDVAVPRAIDADVVGHAQDGADHIFVWLEVRDGRVQGTSTVRVRDPAGSTLPHILAKVLALVYEDKVIPRRIYTAIEPEDDAILQQVLTERRGARSEIQVPRRGLQRRLLGIAGANAENASRVRQVQGEQNERLLDSLAAALGLANRPRRIECFDISNLAGKMAVGSMAVAIDGAPTPAQYRSYRIKEARGDDDYASMREVLTRRITRALDEGTLPDLIVVDGGPGQLRIALSVTEELGVSDLPLIALAKGPDRNAGRETIYRPVGTPLRLPVDDPRLHLLQRIRDEAHRFAVSYNRNLRSQRDRSSTLAVIPGLGPKRIQRLLQTFGSINAIRRASIDQLTAVAGMGAAVATRVHTALNGDAEPTVKGADPALT